MYIYIYNIRYISSVAFSILKVRDPLKKQPVSFVFQRKKGSLSVGEKKSHQLLAATKVQLDDLDDLDEAHGRGPNLEPLKNRWDLLVTSADKIAAWEVFLRKFPSYTWCISDIYIYIHMYM